MPAVEVLKEVNQAYLANTKNHIPMSPDISHPKSYPAAESGLATIPAVTLVHYPEILRNKLGIPDNFSIVIGIAISYEDKQHPINKFKSARRPVSDVAIIKGIE